MFIYLFFPAQLVCKAALSPHREDEARVPHCSNRMRRNAIFLPDWLPCFQEPSWISYQASLWQTLKLSRFYKFFFYMFHNPFCVWRCCDFVVGGWWSCTEHQIDHKRGFSESGRLCFPLCKGQQETNSDCSAQSKHNVSQEIKHLSIYYAPTMP